MWTLLLLATLAQAPALAPPDPDSDEALEPEPPAVVPPLPVASLSPSTQELFERLKRRVAQVRIIERRSGSRSSIGSAFFVDAEGLSLIHI